MNYTQQENNYPKAFGATGVILLLIAALCYFLVFGPPPAIEDGTGGILVNYGTTEEGMGSDYMNTQEPSMAEKANNTRPDKVTPTPPTEEKASRKVATVILLPKILKMRPKWPRRQRNPVQL
ncbi:hypothetical protein [Mucilaginibacter antarcticus]|uniref:hypothetical protein n=1 Tax=Mucilaginibacter antarcticus TaxID=1855725 RepID=UPI00362B6B12